MFHFLSRYHRVTPLRRLFSTTRQYFRESHFSTSNVIHQIEHDGARILQAVSKRVKLRDELLASVRLLVNSLELKFNIYTRCLMTCPLRRTLRVHVNSKN